jgi:D-sedoheptulose 7-phosphate isomerase
MQSILTDYVRGLRQCLDEIEKQDVAGAADIIYQAYLEGKQVFVFGNGGSAATASHMVCDLRKGASVPGKPRLRMTCLSDNTPLMTAIGNDISYEDVFVEQLISQVQEGDVVIAISCSGNSPNVLKAVEYAKKCGAVSIGFTACGGGLLGSLVDLSITLSTRDFGQAEDIHLSLEHLLSYMVKSRIASEE